MPTLQRLTTEYIEKEDRIRISGEGGNGELHTFWLTQRLLCRLIHVLVSAIEATPALSEKKNTADDRTNALFNEMAQQAAQQQIPDQPPVVDTELDRSWLVIEVDVTKADQHVKLGFKNNNDELAELLLDQKQLRQWLSIVFKQWQQAEWPTSIWPDWILNTMQKTPTASKAAVH